MMPKTRMLIPTAAAATSLITLIFSLCLNSTKSRSASIALFKISAVNTKPVASKMSNTSTHCRSAKAAARTITDSTSLYATLKSESTA